jgi:DNA-binding transcriptional LysR family regulator
VVSAPQPGLKIDPDLILEPIAHQVEMPVISARHPLAKKPNPQISDLSDLMWGLPPKGNRRIRRLREIFQALGLQPPIHFLRTDSDTMAVAMIKEGLIVGLANVDTLEREIREKSVIVLPFDELKIDRQIVIVKRRRSRLTPVAEALFEQVKVGRAPPMLAAAQ